MWRDILIDFLFIALELTVLFVGITFVISLFQGIIPYKKLEKYLFKANSVLGAVIAIIFAFITPFCSCSTIPIVATMLQKNIRFGYVMIFLFASPVLDPTILTLMGYLLGWKVTLLYTLITIALSIIIGFTLEAFGFKSSIKNVIVKQQNNQPSGLNVKAAWKETITLIKTVYPFLLIGALIGSMIKGVVPTEWIAQTFGGQEWWLIPLAALIGIPLYIRLSTMIPIANILLIKGMALGPVMAIMISSAGASLPEITLLHSIFHKRLVIAFMISVLSMATISGTLFIIV